MTPSLFEELLEALASFSGIGRKMAQRMAIQVLEWDSGKAKHLAQLLVEAKEKIKTCQRCFNIAEDDLCYICQEENRQRELCVVETFLDVIAIEKTGQFKGHYHVLGGVYSPSDGIGLDKLHLTELREHIQEEQIQECLIATNPNPQGETTAYFVREVLKDIPVRITRIGRGLPIGSFIDYADTETLSWALRSRAEMSLENSNEQEVAIVKKS